ncbi:LacI family DNA-binding transcriptional regulator [Nonomuraea bangladeshensis]
MTITDVARLAGVSPSTASKALNGRDQVRATTRQRVAAAARELGYTPNPVAQQLRGTSTHRTVGFLAGDGIGRFTLPVLLGATHALGPVSVTLCDSRGDQDLEREHLIRLGHQQVDGVIVLGSSTDPRPPLTARIAAPVVYAMSPSSDPADLSVIPDEWAGARLAVEHLLDSGRRRVAVIGGPAGQRANKERLGATRETLRARGLRLAGSRPYLGEWSEAWGRAATAMLLRDDPGVDAVFCTNDQLARGAVETLRESGRRVPDDVAVVGYDNWSPYVTESRPPISSVDMELEALGRHCIRLLFGAEPRPDGPGPIRLPCRLVRRESSDPDAVP